MRKLFRPRKRGTFGQELIGAVAQVGLWVGAFAAFRGMISLLQADQPPQAVGDFFALFSPTFAAVCVIAGPLLATGSLVLRFRVTPKG